MADTTPQTFRRLNFTDKYFACHVLLTISLAIAGLLYLIFADVQLINFIVAGAVFLVFVIMTIVVQFLNCFNSFLYKKIKSPKMKRGRIYVMVFSAVLVVMGLAPRIMVYFLEYNSHTYAFFTMCNLIIPILMMSHLANYDYVDRIYHKRFDEVWLAIIIHSILLVASIRLAVAYSDVIDSVSITVCQLMMAPISFVHSIDFYVAMRGDIRMKDYPASFDVANTVRVAPVEAIEVEALATVVQQQVEEEEKEERIECRICVTEYSDLKVPRILKECGHTICHDCADVLLNRFNRHYMMCPFCQMITVVRGNANLLPRNFSMIEIIDERNKKRGVPEVVVVEEIKPPE